LRYRNIGKRILSSRLPLLLAIGLAPVVTGLYVVQITFYVFYPNYNDHVAPTVASIGWLGLHGQALYLDWATGDVYGMLYGPMLYLFNGLFLLAMPTLAMSKISRVIGDRACSIFLDCESKKQKTVSLHFLFSRH
jgi:hypothetical protein